MFYNFSKSKNFPSFSVSGWTGRPDRSTGSCVQDVHTRACLSVGLPVDRPKTSALCFSVGRPTGRPTKKLLLSVFCRSADRSTAFTKLCFLFEAGRPKPNGYMPARLTADRTGRPPSLPEPQRLFPLWYFSKICFWICFLAELP